MSAPKAAPPAYRRIDGGLAPTEIAGSPWGPHMQGGNSLTGALGWAAESHRPEGFLPARLTMDLFRAAPMTPFRIERERVREGGRIHVVDVRFVAEDGPFASARCLFVRRKGDDEPVYGAPPPLPPREDCGDLGIGPKGFDPSPGLHSLLSYHNVLDADRAAGWVGYAGELVEGEPLTPFVRVASCSDLINPLSMHRRPLKPVINADVDLRLVREPTGPWIGFQIADSMLEAGVGHSSGWLSDDAGFVGRVTVTQLQRSRF